MCHDRTILPFHVFQGKDTRHGSQFLTAKTTHDTRNCIELMNMNYHGVFTQPIPEFHPDGVDFISSSGGTALFIIESALTKRAAFLFCLVGWELQAEWSRGYP